MPFIDHTEDLKYITNRFSSNDRVIIVKVSKNRLVKNANTLFGLAKNNFKISTKSIRGITTLIQVYRGYVIGVYKIHDLATFNIFTGCVNFKLTRVYSEKLGTYIDYKQPSKISIIAKDKLVFGTSPFAIIKPSDSDMNWLKTYFTLFKKSNTSKKDW